MRKPLSSFPRFQTQDPESWEEFIINKVPFSKYCFTEDKNFLAFYNSTTLGNIRLIGVGNNSKFRHTFTQPSEDLVCNLLLHGNYKSEYNNIGSYYKKNSVALDCAEGITKQVESNSPVSIQLIFSKLSFYKFINAIIGDKSRALSVGVAPRVSRNYLSDVILGVEKVLNLYPLIATQPIIAAQYEQLLYLSIANAYPKFFEQYVPDILTNPQKVVKTVEEYIKANASEPLRVQDLVAIAGVCARTIQESFKKYRGYSPSNFLRECRMLRARRLLEKADPNTTILSVSLACGFASQGRFSQYFRQRFGVNPSELLVKSMLKL